MRRFTMRFGETRMPAINTRSIDVPADNLAIQELDTTFTTDEILQLLHREQVTRTSKSWQLGANQKHHPDCSAVVLLLLPDCPFRLSGLSIYVRFSQSFTYIGLLATVSGQRRPTVSTAPLGSKYLTH
jgi:hypothetical protein